MHVSNIEIRAGEDTRPAPEEGPVPAVSQHNSSPETFIVGSPGQHPLGCTSVFGTLSHFWEPDPWRVGRRLRRDELAEPNAARPALGGDMVNLKIVFSRGFLHWTRVMGHGDESGAVLTCYQVDYGR